MSSSQVPYYDNLYDLLVRTRELVDQGTYEQALLQSFTGCRHNNKYIPLDTLERMFQRADRAKMLAAGDPLPGTGPFTVYRGVNGRTTTRRVRGLSWTDDLDRACWFAARYCGHDPAVYTATVTADEVFAFADDRDEREFIVRPAKCKRVPFTLDQLKAAQNRVVAAQYEQQQQRLAQYAAKPEGVAA